MLPVVAFVTVAAVCAVSTLESSSPTNTLEALLLGAYPITPDVFHMLFVMSLRWYAPWTCNLRAGHVLAGTASHV